MAYVPISLESHGKKRWLRHSSLSFARGDTATPLFVNEISDALQSMPIAFIRQNDRFTLAVVMGLRPGENLFVDENNAWQSTYMPVIYRSSPFELVPIQGQDEQTVLCIDEKCISDTNNGEEFFSDDGEVSDNIINIFELLKKFNSFRMLTENICTVLSDFNLISPWPLKLHDGNDELTVNGLYRINEEALGELSDESFLKLRETHALPLAYAQLLSMKNIEVLLELLRRKIQAEASKIKPSFSNETFNFSGLN
ncbi:hypothetical protein M2401_006351 [Pseudomonas sp. JUb42]|uniref:SapC family protein n=1 Tax=Pseudomonas sp. JUb42 TaxID=2940611 RepID=UPI00216A576A|nr:SapC family protein [Pseudomonas sp. JUb42]MCS3472586.1 hypothetical protein [Pseudomonas sp. JUb42]